MTELDLRALVREAVDRHVGGRRDHSAPAGSSAAASPHASHGVYITLVNTGEACVIEPDVACTHCNYCKSHGY